MFDQIDNPAALPPAYAAELQELAQKSTASAGRRFWQYIESGPFEGVGRRTCARTICRRRSPASRTGGASPSSAPRRRPGPRPDRRPALLDAAHLDASRRCIAALEPRRAASPPCGREAPDRPALCRRPVVPPDDAGPGPIPYEAADVLLASYSALHDDWDAIVRRGIFVYPDVWGRARRARSAGKTFTRFPRSSTAVPQVFASGRTPPRSVSRPKVEPEHGAGPPRRRAGRPPEAGAGRPAGWDPGRGRLVIDTPYTQGFAGWSGERAGLVRSTLRFHDRQPVRGPRRHLHRRRSRSPRPTGFSSRPSPGSSRPAFAGSTTGSATSPTPAGPPACKNRSRPASSGGGRARCGPTCSTTPASAPAGAPLERLPGDGGSPADRRQDRRLALGVRRRVSRPMKTIVTGGAGLHRLAPGRPPARRRRRGHRRRQLRPVLPRAAKEANLAAALRNPRCRLVELDIRDAAGGRGAGPRRRRPDAIVHLAARAGVRPSIDDPAALRRRQRPGDGRLARGRLPARAPAAVRLRVELERLRRPPDAPFRETDPVDLPVSPYAATKKACELLAYTFHHLHGLPVTGPAVLHGLRPAEPPRPGDRQVHPADRPRRAGADVRRRHDPARLHLRRRHRRRRRPRDRALLGSPSLQPGPLRADRAADMIEAIAEALGSRRGSSACPNSRATSARPTPISPGRRRAGLRAGDALPRGAEGVRGLASIAGKTLAGTA